MADRAQLAILVNWVESEPATKCKADDTEPVQIWCREIEGPIRLYHPSDLLQRVGRIHPQVLERRAHRDRFEGMVLKRQRLAFESQNEGLDELIVWVVEEVRWR